MSLFYLLFYFLYWIQLFSINNFHQMTTKQCNVLVISPDYKFKKTVNRCSLQKKSKIHCRKITSILQYRAYDKQRLLQQIDNKLTQKNNAISQNKQLKAQISKIVSQSMPKKQQYIRKTSNQKSMNGTTTTLSKLKICSLNTTLSNTRIYSTLISLKEDNQMLTKQIQRKNDDIAKIKRSQQYCQFQEVLAECLVFKEEVGRLKAILKERKRKKMEIRREKTKIRNQKICQILNQKRGIEFLAGHSAQLKENLDTILQQIAHLKNRNKQMGKTRRRLMEDIQNLRNKTKIDQLQTPKQKNQRISYNPTKKNKQKQTSPATILQLQQQQNQNSAQRKQNNKRQENIHRYKSHQNYEQQQDEDDEDGDEDDQNQDSIGSEQQVRSQPQSRVRDKQIDSF